MNTKLYTITNPTADTDTLLVDSNTDFLMVSIIVCNKGSSSATFTAKLKDSSLTDLATIIYQHELEAGDSETFDLRSVSLPTGYSLYVSSSSSDLDFVASGASND